MIEIIDNRKGIDEKTLLTAYKGLRRLNVEQIIIGYVLICPRDNADYSEEDKLSYNREMSILNASFAQFFKDNNVKVNTIPYSSDYIGDTTKYVTCDKNFKMDEFIKLYRQLPSKKFIFIGVGECTFVAQPHSVD